MRTKSSVKKQEPNITALSLIFDSLGSREKVRELANDPKAKVAEVGAEQALDIGKNIVTKILHDGSTIDSAEALASLILNKSDDSYEVDEKKLAQITTLLKKESSEFIDGFMPKFAREMVQTYEMRRRVQQVVEAGGVINTGTHASRSESESFIITHERNGERETVHWSGRGRKGEVIGAILNLGPFKEFDSKNVKDFIREEGVVSGNDPQFGAWSVSTVQAYRNRQ